ncbi:MAG: enoyl-CoA hydratase/isomerase family protein [Actinobacteria bacterium]|nr:enoyl-CoA hydratase/isomerase family protein [Actinomycetota bacterium]
MPVVTLRDLVGAVDRAELSSLHRRGPLVVVAPRPRSDEESERAALALRTAPAVTVLVDDPVHAHPDLAVAADICLTEVGSPHRPWVQGSVDDLVGPVDEHAEAALALVALLRATEDLDVWSAIAAEAATYAMLLGSNDHHRWLTAHSGSDPDRDHPNTAHSGSDPDRDHPPSFDHPNSARSGSDPECAVAAERSGAILRVTLDRPERRNALDRVMRDELIAALDVARADPSIERVELDGNGPDFCAGGDLDEFGATSDPAVAFAVRLAAHPGAAVHLVADRLTATIHGNCIGAGIEVPAFADRVIARADLRVALPELSMGLVPGAGGTVSIPRRIGRQRTAWLALTGTAVDASTALAWGLVDEVGDASGR